MKFLVFSDSHGDPQVITHLKENAKDVDFFLCGGDFTIFGINIEQILSQLNQLGKKVYLIHGNHEVQEEVQDLVQNFANIDFVHKTEWEIQGVKFFAYGGGGFDIEEPEFVQLTQNKTYDILLLHQPPYDTVDYVGNNITGNVDFRKYIDEKQPKMVFCGHIHDCEGMHVKVNETFIMNVGPMGVVIEYDANSK